MLFILNVLWSMTKVYNEILSDQINTIESLTDLLLLETIALNNVSHIQLIIQFRE